MNKILFKISKVVVNNKIVELFKKNPNLTWPGTQASLMEVVLMIHMTGEVKNDRGRKASLTELTIAMFRLFNKKPPRNPTKIINNLRKRQKPKEKSILYRVLKYLYPKLLHM